ncbi:VWA domain-containing protein [Pseudomonadales bacterium]|nr:VWA domain-containing protein [Pseudomonadales bacterium]
MLLSLLGILRRHRLPVSTGEWLDLLSALNAGVVFSNLDAFYYLARLCLVKDERYFDRFDQAFSVFVAGLDAAPLDSSDAILVGAITDLLASHEALELDEAQLRRLLQGLMTRPVNATEPHLMDLNRLVTDAGQRTGLPADGAAHPAIENLAASDATQSETARAQGSLDAASGRALSDQAEDRGEDESEGEGDAGDSESGEPGQQGDGGQQGVGQSQETGRGTTHEFPRVVGERYHQEARRFGTASKVWEQRAYQALDDDAILGVRSLRLSLRYLRKWVRQSQIEELDLSETIQKTAAGGGFLDIKMRPERRNGLKLVLLLDSGGSMDAHAEICYQLFSAVKAELKSLQCYRFHNCIYDTLTGFDDGVLAPDLSTTTFLSRLDSGTRMIIVGDGQVGLPELLEVGGSLRHYNATTGVEWLTRIQDRCRQVVWLNPVPEQAWPQWPSVALIQNTMAGRMHPLTPAGLTSAAKALLR